MRNGVSKPLGQLASMIGEGDLEQFNRNPAGKGHGRHTPSGGQLSSANFSDFDDLCQNLPIFGTKQIALPSQIHLSLKHCVFGVSFAPLWGLG